MNKKIVFSIMLLLSTTSHVFRAAEGGPAQDFAALKLELTRLRAEQEAAYLAELKGFIATCKDENKELEALAATQKELAAAIAEKETLKTNRKNSEGLYTAQVAALNKEIEALTQKINTLQQALTESQANYETEEATYKQKRNKLNKETLRWRKEESRCLELIAELQVKTTQAQAAVIAAGAQLNATKAERLKLKGGLSWTATFGLATDTDKAVDLSTIESYSPKRAVALPGAHESQQNS